MTTTQTTPTIYSDLVQQSSCFNPMFLNGKQIENIVFYDADKGAEIMPGYDNLRWFGSNNNNYPLIRLPFEFKKKNSIDLTSKQAFYTSFKHKYSFDKGKIVVYIPIHLMDSFTDLGESLQFETDTEKNYRHNYSFKVWAKCIEHEYNKKTDKIIYSTSELKETTITFSGRYRATLKPFGKKVQNITDRIKTVYPEISSYTVEKILTVCDINIK